jgi:hypothetical protein
MGLLVAIVVLPLVFTIAAAYIVLRLALWLLRLVFLPLALVRRTG